MKSISVSSHDLNRAARVIVCIHMLDRLRAQSIEAKMKGLPTHS